MRSIFALAAAVSCTGTPTDSGAPAEPAGGRCIVGPSVEITSPDNAATFEEGAAISFVAAGSSEVDAADHLAFLWSYYDVRGVNGEGNIGTGANQSWTPPAPGDWRVVVQIEDSCTREGKVELGAGQQDDVRVTVTALDSGGA